MRSMFLRGPRSAAIEVKARILRAIISPGFEEAAERTHERGQMLGKGRKSPEVIFYWAALRPGIVFLMELGPEHPAPRPPLRAGGKMISVTMNKLSPGRGEYAVVDEPQITIGQFDEVRFGNGLAAENRERSGPHLSVIVRSEMHHLHVTDCIQVHGGADGSGRPRSPLIPTTPGTEAMALSPRKVTSGWARW